VGLTVWQQCLERLEDELSSQQFNTWIRLLQARLDSGCLRLLANRYVRNQVQGSYLKRIHELLDEVADREARVAVSSRSAQRTKPRYRSAPMVRAASRSATGAGLPTAAALVIQSRGFRGRSRARRTN
jgi:chromosomal replication initiator protein